MSWCGLRARLLVVLVPVLIVLFALDSWGDASSLRRELEKAYDQSLQEPAQALADSLGWDDDGAISLNAAFPIISMFEAINSRQKYLRVSLQTPDGQQQRVLMGPADFPPPPAAVGAPAGASAADGSLRFYNAQVGGQSVRVAALLRSVHDQQGQEWRVLIQAAQSTTRISDALQSLRTETLWRDVRTLLVLVLVVWFGIAWGLRPLRSLREALRGRRSDDLQAFDTGDVPGEVRPLVDAMNDHLGQQRELLLSQQQFLADASHQLRTPLAIMTTQTGYALRETDPADVRTSLQSIQQQLQRSRRVAEQLLALAHANQPARAADTTPDQCDANAVARAVVLAHLPLALDKHQDLGFVDARGEGFDEDEDSTPTDVAPVAASANALFELLANLLHNAIAYTPQHGRISVLVQCGAGQVKILVQDNGPGIAVVDRERVFERFERLPAAGGQLQSAGSGLGLAIARAYARRMHGDVVLEDGEGGQGLCACLCLPLVPGSRSAD